MINSIFLSRNAQFYKVKDNKRITNRIIEDIIKEASKNKQSTSYLVNEFRVSKNINNVVYKYTLRVYKAKKKVDFIFNDNSYDVIHAFILLVEYNNYLIVFKKSTSTITSAISKIFELLDYGKILNIVDDTMYIQKVALRNMTISGEAIHSHSYETLGNLNGLLSMHSAGKAIPQNMKVKKDASSKSLTASTGRIIESSGRCQLDKLFEWAKEQLSIMNSVHENRFLSKFAQPVSLLSILPLTEPKAILLEAHTIREELDSNNIEFIIYKEYPSKKYKHIHNKQTIEKILAILEKVYEIDILRDITSKEISRSIIIDSSTHEQLGNLKINDKSLTFDTPLLRRIYIKENDSCISLQKYLITKKLYSIVFTDFKYMYFRGACFKDSSGKSEIDSILNVLVAQTRFNNITDEKGTISTTHTKFDNTSMFDAVEDIQANDDYIFCDDLGIEWCDHITINKEEKKIRFIHSKASSSSSLSASKMHEVVGQGIKNLGNMDFTLNDFITIKESKFKEKYKISNIERIRKGALEDTDRDIINSVINDYRTHRECILSCSFLSKADIELNFEKIKNDEYVKGNIYQLFWIISSFIHACRGCNVIPIIYCKV
jgi:hypothetical protein